MMVRSKQKFEVKFQHLLMLFFVCIAYTVFADHPKEGMTDNLLAEYTVYAISGDNLPDTVNVFEIAKDVSRIFSEALKFTSLNDIYGDTAYLTALFTNNYASNVVADAYKKDVNARIKSQKGDIGVNFRADYSENFEPGFSVDEDIFYKRRFYFGIEWNVIKGGFLESRAKAKQFELEYFLKDIDSKKLADAENYRSIFNYINFIFNKQKIDVLYERYGLIEQKLKFTTELYHLRYVGWEKVLHIRAKLEDLNQQIAQLESFNQFIPNSIPDTLLGSRYTAEDLPLLDIDLGKLMQIYHNNATTDSIAAIKLAMFSGGMKWWQDISLKPYLRYNLYIDPMDQSRRFGAGGVSLTVPLRFRNKGNLVLAKEAIYKAEANSVFQAGDNELVNHYAEFAFKLKQIKEFYYKKLFADELIRKELVKMDFQDIGFNPIFTLGLIDDKKNIEAEIIDIKKRLYIQLVQMAFYLDEKSPMAFVEILNPSDFTSRYTTGVQIFVNHSTSQNMENKELVNYLWKNEFRDVILESDSWSFSPKTKDLIEKASRDHIYFTLNMKTTSGQIYPDVNADFHQISLIDNRSIKGLHYNQVLNNSPLSPEEQETEFSSWLERIDKSQKPKNIRLSISISDDLSLEILNEIYKKFDLVFIPSDGTPNRKNLEDRLTQEFSLGQDKTTVILDANDFADRLHIENYMANLNLETGVENFAISNVKNMIDADLRSFRLGEENSVASEGIMAAIRIQIFADDQKKKEDANTQLDTEKNLAEENYERAEATNIQEINIDNPDFPVSVLESREDEVEPDAQSWQIELAASIDSLSEQYLKDKFKVEETIDTYLIDGYNVYTFGNYQSKDVARAALNDYKTQSGNQDAFIVSYE